MGKIEKFESLQDMDGIIANMDDYGRMPLFAEDGIGRMSGKRANGMINLTKRHVTMTVGENYPVFDHKKAFGCVSKGLHEHKIAVHGRFETVGDRVYADILFDEVKHINEPGTEGMDIGMTFSNPMDKKTAFKGSGYTYRIICSNGMKAKSLLPNMEISEWHTANMLSRVPSMIAEFVKTSLVQSNHLQLLSNKAMQQKVVFISREELEATVTAEYQGISERHVKGVLKQIKSLEPTRWDLFNAGTYYSSHTGVSREIIDKLDTVSEKFLDISRAIKIITPTKAAVPVVASQ